MDREVIGKEVTFRDEDLELGSFYGKLPYKVDEDKKYIKIEKDSDLFSSLIAAEVIYCAEVYDQFDEICEEFLNKNLLRTIYKAFIQQLKIYTHKSLSPKKKWYKRQTKIQMMQMMMGIKRHEHKNYVKIWLQNVFLFNDYFKKLKNGRDLLHMDTFTDLMNIELWKNIMMTVLRRVVNLIMKMKMMKIMLRSDHKSEKLYYVEELKSLK